MNASSQCIVYLVKLRSFITLQFFRQGRDELSLSKNNPYLRDKNQILDMNGSFELGL